MIVESEFGEYNLIVNLMNKSVLNCVLLFMHIDQIGHMCETIVSSGIFILDYDDMYQYIIYVTLFITV